MFRLNNKTRKYQTPSVKVTQMALESNFCQTGLRLNAQVDELRNINKDVEDKKLSEPLYFEF
jgi:hypothetical protein